jgi:hypothetical protein
MGLLSDTDCPQPVEKPYDHECGNDLGRIGTDPRATRENPEVGKRFQDIQPTSQIVRRTRLWGGES